ncbi:MAG: hypothetical protein JW712_13700 [Dehalococcoidales bacterium]|nr:hypothetical protein [Dehalococcoidales bacterium]
MSVAKELYKLQEIDIETASREQTRTGIIEQLKDNTAIITTRAELDSGKNQLDEYSHKQHTLEWEIDDLSARLSKFEDELYSGRTTNPKELSSLQHEIDNLKAQKAKLEDQDLELMELLEQAESHVANLESRLEQLQKEWVDKQKQLTAELKEVETIITGLNEKRQALAATFDSQTMTIYDTLKKQRGTAVARVERGICRGCRISLPVGELQQVRGGGMVRCSSCGRVLFLDQ